MDHENIREQIQEGLRLLEQLKGFDPRVEEGIKSFKEIDRCIIDPTKENVELVKGLVAEMKKAIEPYRAFIPSLIEVLENLEKWCNTVLD